MILEAEGEKEVGRWDTADGMGRIERIDNVEGNK